MRLLPAIALLLPGGADQSVSHRAPISDRGALCVDSVPDRAVLERQFRERLEQVVREKLQLSEDRIKQLRSVTDQFHPQYQQLRDREMALYGELIKETGQDNANQQRIAEMIDETMDIMIQRTMIMKAEQRELAKFLTPQQRSKYIGLKFELQRKIYMDRREEQKAKAKGTDGAGGK